MTIIGKFFITGIIMFFWGFFMIMIFDGDKIYVEGTDNDKIFFAVICVLPTILGLVISFGSLLIGTWLN